MPHIAKVLVATSHVRGELGKETPWQHGKDTNLNTLLSSQRSILHNICQRLTKKGGTTKREGSSYNSSSCPCSTTSSETSLANASATGALQGVELLIGLTVHEAFTNGLCHHSAMPLPTTQYMPPKKASSFVGCSNRPGIARTEKPAATHSGRRRDSGRTPRSQGA
jgi:hypothetical protein